MKESIDAEKIAEHWINTSDKDFQTMEHLYKSKDYNWALFMGHIVIEKLLKACVTKATRQHAPPLHDLLRLANLAKIELTPEYTDWLDVLTTFNLNTRYDNYKQDFYKKCTPEFTDEWINRIHTLRTWIKQTQLS
jgi:HEPN domain-containing protein